MAIRSKPILCGLVLTALPLAAACADATGWSGTVKSIPGEAPIVNMLNKDGYIDVNSMQQNGGAWTGHAIRASDGAVVTVTIGQGGAVTTKPGWS